MTIHTRTLAVAMLVVAPILFLRSAAVTVEVVVDVGGSLRDTATLDAGQWRAYRMMLSLLDSVRIAVQVAQGGPIDVFATGEFGFGQYQDPNSSDFGYYTEGSRPNTTSFLGTFTPPTNGQYYLILDNTAITDPGAIPSGQVIVDVTLDKASLLPIVAGILVTIAAVGVGAVWFLRSRRRSNRRRRPRQRTHPGQHEAEPSERDRL